MIVTAAAPIRVCDCGGWTDTWFARYGRVFNIAVRPCAEVQVEVFPAGGDRPRVVIDALDFGDRYAPAHKAGHWDRHPLLEATLDALPMPAAVAIEATITCEAPAGASTGTSAAVTVALCGALDRVRGGTLHRREIARLAHAIETDGLKQQSGIQDQICSAMGGVNDIEMTGYPDAEVRPLRLSDATRWELERRLALVFLGRGHRSSDVHERVIAHLSGLGPDCADLAALRKAACDARDALADGDFAGLGRAMRENTEGQRRLHPDLVCADADRVIAVAREHGAAGWKVNGAGGDGGSLTLVGPVSATARRAMLREIRAEVAGASVIPTRLDADGLRVWTSAPRPRGSQG
jgi:D-glycero-alpha-D-manno-heptose-7-phosphate kinase